MITALAGGVGAAKLLSGLAEVMPQEQLTVVVNTGDDFDWMGLRVCPDLDTIVYTLAGAANPVTGWGIRNDTFAVLERLGQLGGPQWFRIGDNDAATHLLRTGMLRSGVSLTEVTRCICIRMGVRSRILPMTDDFVPTQIQTDEGLLSFQDYFVKRRCEPQVRGIVFCGADESRPAFGVLDAILAADAVVVCPSNPLISIAPILAIPQLRGTLRQIRDKVVAVSPLIGGRALKGPTADMLAQLGYEVSAAAVAALYRDFVGSFVLDSSDEGLADQVARFGVRPRVAQILMNSREARVGLARQIVEMLG